mgnify:CR=1 FL=1
MSIVPLLLRGGMDLALKPCSGEIVVQDGFSFFLLIPQAD